MSGQWVKRSVRRTWSAARGPKAASGSAPSTSSVSSQRVPVGAEHDGAALGGAHEREADPVVLAQGGQQPRVALLQLLQRHAAGKARERDQAQAA